MGRIDSLKADSGQSYLSITVLPAVSNGSSASEAFQKVLPRAPQTHILRTEFAEQEYCKIAFAISIVVRYIVVNVGDSSMSNLYNQGSDHECAKGVEE